MIQRAVNIVLPKTKVLEHTEDNDQELANFACRRMLDEFTKHDLQDAQTLTIIWTDKQGLQSSAYCNVNPLNRLMVLVIAWIQELFDFRIKKDESKE